MYTFYMIKYINFNRENATVTLKKRPAICIPLISFFIYSPLDPTLRLRNCISVCSISGQIRDKLGKKKR